MDYLVNLSLLSPDPQLDAQIKAAGVTIRRALAPELERATAWIREKFSAGWSSETAIAFSRQPPSCFLATKSERLVGFACYNSRRARLLRPDRRRRGGARYPALATRCCLRQYARHAHAWATATSIIGDVGPLGIFTSARSAPRGFPNSAARRLCRPAESHD